jgi:hypothetical protein
MTFQELQTEIELLVDTNTAAINALIPDLINDAVLNAVNEPGILVPDLKVIRNVNTEENQSYATMEGVYNGKLIFASVGGVKIDPHKTLEDLLTIYPTMQEVGSIEAIALEGSTIWYAKIPEEVQTLTLLLYSNPDPLTLPNEVPLNIPVHLHRLIIIPFAARIMFDMIEQDEETKKTQTRTQELNYLKGIVKFREYLAARRRGMSRSIWNV